jgi:hypothetical protein
MQRHVFTLAFILLAALLLIPGCLPVNGGRSGDERAGFFTGVWHGWIAPVSVVLGIFDSTIRVYEVNNTGWWYDLGFYMAVISGFGGLSLIRRHKNQEQA